jgi:CubicO group peptidase (beta-lactamase class C family)
MTLSAVSILSVILATGPAALAPLLDQLRTEQDVPGVSAVVTRAGDVLFAGGSGVADIETGRAMTPDTLMYSGSLSKIFTATLVLNLVDHDLLSLDQPVDGIADGQADVTIAHLLTHSSGLVREGDFGYWFSGEFPDRVALTTFLGNTELGTPPGESVRYSNIGFATLGLAIEDAADSSYHDALRQRVLTPLGMDRSGSPGPAEDIAPGYTPAGRIIPSAERPFAGVGRAVGDRHLREYHDAAAMTPAFGIYSTANDLGRLARFLLGYGGDDVLPADLRTLMLEPQASRRTYGLGSERYQGRRLARHGGWFAAHKSHILIDLDADVGVAVLANSDNADPDTIAKALLAAVLDSTEIAD